MKTLKLKKKKKKKILKYFVVTGYESKRNHVPEIVVGSKGLNLLPAIRSVSF